MKNKLKHSIVSWAALLLLVLGIQAFNERGLATGTPPPLAAPDLQGKPFPGLDSLGKPALVYFWASWCPVCRSMENGVAELSAEVPTITVALQSGTAAEVSEYLRKQGLNLPTLVDEAGVLGKGYGLRGVPAAFIIGRDGRIHSATAGYTSAWGLRLRLWLASL